MSAEWNPKRDLILYSGPNWDDREIEAGCRALREGKWLPAGEQVQKFERAFSRMFKHNESLMVNSGSSANLVMLAALKAHYGWPDGAEVIVSPVGFPTTIAPIVQNKLTPRFVDICLDDLNFDLNLVSEAAHSGKACAIFLSPVLGNPPDMDELLDIPTNIILDGCDSLGSKWGGELLSKHAVATSCSFYPAHHITTGEGGMVSSPEKEVIKLARQFAWWGRDCYCVGSANQLPCGTCGKRFDDWLGDGTVVDHKYVFSQMGYNLKPLDLQGAIGCEQLKKFDLIHFNRRKNKTLIGGWLRDIPGLRVVSELHGAETSWFGVPIVCESAELKQRLVKHCEANRIQTRNYFAGNILQHPGYRHLGDFREYPNANEVLRRVFFLGCHPGYSDIQLSYIEGVIRGFPREAT